MIGLVVAGAHDPRRRRRGRRVASAGRDQLAAEDAAPRPHAARRERGGSAGDVMVAAHRSEPKKRSFSWRQPSGPTMTSRMRTAEFCSSRASRGSNSAMKWK